MVQNSSTNNKRIAKNTVLLYFRMMLTIVLQLITVPLVLRQLGSSDYGLNNVIGGITAMFTFVSTSMASGAQRYFAFAIGNKDDKLLKTLFNTTFSIYVILSIAVFVLFEAGGVWFVNTKMQIPEGRQFAANMVFQFSIITFIIGLISVPYNAVVIAREKMNIYAYVSIAVSFFKLLAVFLLFIVDFDYLIFYAFSIMLIQALERMFYQVYCKKNFIECKSTKLEYDKQWGHQLLVYSGFNIIGAIAIVLRRQGLNIVMNLFFGTILNAAHAIANQISHVIEQLVSNLYIASRPQITKYYATGNLNDMWRLVYSTSLLAFYLVMIVGIVAFIEMPTILNLWLHNVPEYTVSIARLFICCLLLETTTNQLVAVFQSYNRIKEYQIYSSSILLLNVPVAYFFLKYGEAKALVPYYVQLVFSLIYVLSLLIVSKKVTKLNLKHFVTNVILREITVLIIVSTLTLLVVDNMAPNLWRIFVTLFMTLTISIVMICTIGLQSREKEQLKSYLKAKVIKCKTAKK